ncbi:MAG: hypothetical protein GC159_00940 [Phycisphaera sp.]|nr:hypothetical protein [Phycisphaera sp.]
MRTMTRDVATAAMLAAVCLTLALPHRADAAPPPPKPQPTAAPDYNYVHFRIAELERQIAERIAQSGDANEVDRQVFGAQINYRIVARSLLKAGREKGPDGAVAILYGHTLADHAAEADELFARLSGFTTVVRDLSRKSDDPQVEAGRRFKVAMDDFAEATQAAADELSSASPDAVDRYLQKMLASMTVAHSAAGGDELRSTWPRAVGATGPTLELADVQQIIALHKEIADLSIPARTKKEMQQIVAMMQQGWPHPEIRPHVVKFYDLMEQAAMVARAFGEASGWLGQQTSDELLDQLHMAVLLVKDPRTREAGVERFDTLSRDLAVMDRLAELDRQAVPIHNMRAAFLKAHELRVKSSDLRTAEALTRLIERATAPMLAYRAMLGGETHATLKRTVLQLGAAYQKEELRLINAMGALTTAPQQVHDPQWSEQIDGLVEKLNRFRRVQTIPKWVDVMNEFKPRPAGGLFRRLTAMANDLSNQDPDTAATANDALRRLDEQAELFLTLPYTEHLIRGDEPVQEVTGGAYSLILDQIDRQRQLLATAWATGDDATANAENLRKLKRLLRAIHLTLSVQRATDLGDRLNRWAAWEVAPTAVHPLMGVLPDRVKQACRFAAVANFPDLETQLAKIERDSALPLLIARLAEDLGPALPQLPDKLGGALSQCLYPPTDTDYAASRRAELAQISVYLMEAEHARISGNAAQFTEVLNYVADLAMHTLNALDATPAVEVVIPMKAQ